jgi:hypothetical protein
MSKIPSSSSPPQAMQWAGLIIATLLTVAPMIIAYVTKNPYYLAPSFPLSFLWHSLAKFLYKRPEDYHLDELKIKHRVQKPNQKKLQP